MTTQLTLARIIGGFETTPVNPSTLGGANTTWVTSEALIAGTVSVMEAHLTANTNPPGSARGVIYTDSAGLPGTLVAATEAVVLDDDVAGWVTFQFATPPVLTEGDYWIGVHLESANVDLRRELNGAGHAIRSNLDTFSDGTSTSFATNVFVDSRRGSAVVVYSLPHLLGTPLSPPNLTLTPA